MIDKLVGKIKKLNAPIVVGLDPNLAFVPDHIQKKAFDEYARILLPLAYDDFFAAAKSAMKPRHRTMLHKLLDFHFDRRATRYNLPPNRLKMIEKEVQRRARVLLG